MPVALLIQGSGPTVRDGNQLPKITTDLLKKVAYSLAKGGIATLRFDKRGVAGNLPHRPEELAAFSRWENFVDDVVSAFYFLESQPEVDSNRIAMVGA